MTVRKWWVRPAASSTAGALRDDDTTAIHMQVVARNMGLGLLLVHFFFAGREENAHVLYCVLFYSGAVPFLVAPGILAHRYGRSPVLGRRPYRRPTPPATTGAGRSHADV